VPPVVSASAPLDPPVPRGVTALPPVSGLQPMYAAKPRHAKLTLDLRITNFETMRSP
jgi:hypothetical protein